ncbi:hypothetical protein WBJ53_08725 [Spirosoma sp. SC4-14]|uniref:hypothetical protein n=1 Tax=Spirosoma sp. SC4-14 TaxID=3128900 RepID=UPI0030CB8592
MNNDTNDVKRREAQINGRTEGPFGSDDTDVDLRKQDNKHQYEQENSANGLDSLQVRGGQDGRNDRAIGSTDMDSKNGILRMGDQNNSTMEVTQEGLDSAVEQQENTNTAMVDVTTSGPDDYASARQVGTPEAEQEAKEQNNKKQSENQPKNSDSESQQDADDEIAQTGTDLSYKPAY